MHAYKFDTIVHENGIIKIPEIKNLANHKVEIFIVDKDEVVQKTRPGFFDDFCKKWGGFLGDSAVDLKDDRIDYLMDKYK